MPKPEIYTGVYSTSFAFGILWTVCLIHLAGIGQGIFPEFTSVFRPFDLIPWGIGFVCVSIGLLILLFPLWHCRQQLRTVYAITDRRVIILDDYFTSYPPESLTTIRCREQKDGTGDVIFTRTEWEDAVGHTTMCDIGFHGIPHAETVETLLKSIALQCDAQKSGLARA